MKNLEKSHACPTGWSDRKWKQAIRIIDVIAERNSVTDPERDPCLSIVEIADSIGITPRMVREYLRELTSLRIIGRKCRFSANGRQLTAAMWVMNPDKQIQSRKVRRSRRVAEALPQIRQALTEDRESLRSVAKRFGVSADTVQEVRKEINPYDPGTAVPWRCPKCRNMITSPACLRCSL